MDIKKIFLKANSAVFIILCIVVANIPVRNGIALGGFEVEEDYLLLDKVYTFIPPTSFLRIESENVSFDATRMYYLYAKLVSPQNCVMTIVITDPNGNTFEIFEDELKWSESDIPKYYRIPYGCAKSGVHKILYYVKTINPVNIHLKIEKGDFALYDKLTISDKTNLIYHGVDTFEKNTKKEIAKKLEEAVSYKFYIGRVSPISATKQAVITYDFEITDPNNQTFPLLSNATLEGVEEIASVSFGTAVEGVHIVSIEVRSQISKINVGMAITRFAEISVGIDPNDTITIQNQKNNSLFFTNNSFLPVEVILGTIALTMVPVIGVGIFAILFNPRKKKKVKF